MTSPRPLTRTDVLPRADYLAVREAWRRRTIAERTLRRVALGPTCSVNFESRATILYQIHEMLRAEESWDRPGAVDDELAAYAPLVPGGGTLSATIFLEFVDPVERGAKLAELVGIEHHLRLHVGDLAPTPAEFDPLGLSSEKVSAVQYVRFRLRPEASDAFRSGGAEVRLVVDHPAFTASAVMSQATRVMIGDDLV